MSTVTVHTGNYSSYLFIDYTFSKDETNRTWSCSAALKLKMGPSYNFDAWTNTGANIATLQKNGGDGYTHGNTYTLVGNKPVGSGNYDAQGTAPTISVTWAWNVNSSWGGYVNPHGTATLTGPSIPPAADPPSGASITYNSCTWNSATVTAAVSSTGGATCTFDSAVVTGTYNGAADSITQWQGQGRKWVRNSGGSTVISDATQSGSANSPIAIKGLLHYKLGINVINSVGNATAFDSTLRYLPPAPGQFTYTDPGGSGIGTKTYTVNFVGNTTNNHTTYDSAELTRNIRYSLDNGTTWTSVVSAVTALDAVTTFTVAVPAGDVAIVEAYEVYHGMSSDVQSISLANTNTPVVLYGSVNGRSKAIKHLYGSVSGESKKIVKLYASVGGVSKKVFEDV